jgi:hypothetical protein
MKTFKSTILRVVILFLFALPVFSFQQGIEMDDELAKKQDRVRKLFSDISTVNLLNGLHLTDKQMKEILHLAKKAQTIKQEFPGNRGSVYMQVLDEAEEKFTRLFNEIMKGNPAREGSDIEREAVRINHRLKEAQNRAVRTINNELAALDSELSDILTPEQEQVIDDFKPCLIPPKDLKNPVRAGQASSNDHAIKALRRVREIPGHIWDRRKYRLIAHRIERFSRHRYAMSAEEKEEELQRLLSIFEKARAMSDTDFELEKDKLAEELRPVDKIHKLREEIENRASYKRRPKASRKVRYLLNERIIPILEERLKGTN